MLTQGRARQAVEARMEGAGGAHLHFVYADLPAWTRRFARPMERTHYLLWQFHIVKLARRLHADIAFDIVHQLTYNSIEGPGLLWRLGVPFVWGPVGGGQLPPKELRPYFGGRWPLEVLRGARKQALRFNPIVRGAARSAACILTSNEDTAIRLQQLGARSLAREVEVGVPEASLPPIRERAPGRLEIVWAGSLVARKGPLLALDIAEALVRRGAGFRLRMAGKGYLEPGLRRSIAARGLAGHVELLGPLPFEAMNRLYDEADAFLFTSLQDTNGSVVVEALSHGLPVIALDHHGAAEIVTHDCGIKVPTGRPEPVIAAFADALALLAADGPLRQRLSRGAIDRVRDRYLWDGKAEVLARVYREAAAHPLPVTTA